MHRAHPWPTDALALLLAAAVATPSAAQDTVSEGAQWEVRPSQADFERLGPPAAVAGRVSGRATLDCALTAAGRLRDCQVKAETPAGSGFGEAALRLAPLHRLARTQEVELEGSRLTFVVRFRYAEAPATAPAAANPALPAQGPPVTTAPAAIAAITSPVGALERIAVAPGWQADYLDTERLTRDGQLVETFRVTIYAAPRGDYPTGAYEVTQVRVDCAAGAQAAVGVRVFDRSGTAVGWREGTPALPVEPDTVDAAAVRAACAADGPRAGSIPLAEALSAP